MAAPLNDSTTAPRANYQHQPLENTAHLSNGRAITILNGELDIMKKARSLEPENKSYHHYVKEVSGLFKRNVCGIAYYGGSYLCLPFFGKTYLCTKFYFDYGKFPGYKCYSNFDFPMSLVLGIFKTTHYLTTMSMEGLLSSCCAKRKAQQEFILTSEKVRHLIKELKFFKPNEPVFLISLSDGISKIALSEESLQAIIHEMNMDQILELRKLLGKDNFCPLLRFLPKNAVDFIKILNDLDPDQSIFEQVGQERSNILDSFKTYIGNHPKIWEAMVKLRMQHCEIDEKALEEIGEKIIPNPDDAKGVMLALRFKTYGDAIFNS